MVETVCSRQLNLFSVGKQQVTVDFRGGNIVCDAGTPAASSDVGRGSGADGESPDSTEGKQMGSKHAPQAAVQGGSVGKDECSADLVPPEQPLAPPGAVCPGA